MLVLGIESTAHTFGIGIVEDSKILADQRVVFRTEKGGIFPREAARLFCREGSNALRRAIEEAGIRLDEIDLVAFSRGPGLGPCLRTGAIVARYLSLRLQKPIVGVNHPVAHIEIGRLLARAQDPLVVYVSGANTQIIAYSEGRYRVFGETLDMGLGNTIDSLAWKLGFGFPGGPKIAELAEKGKNYIRLPYSVKGTDLSFSGILTAAERLIGKVPVEDLCFSFQETVFAMLVEVTERALAHTGKEEVLVVGGVGANKRLREMLETMASERGAKVKITPIKYCTDNGVMIAWTGLLMYLSGVRHKPTEPVNPKLRVDQENVLWYELAKKFIHA